MEEYCDYCGEPCDIYGHYHGSDVCHDCFDELTDKDSEDE